SLDTKGREYAFARERLERAGLRTLVVDFGVLGEPPFTPDVGAAEVARAGGTELEDLRFSREGSDTRAVALDVMERGAAKIVRELHEDGRCQAVLGLAGSGGSTVASGAMRALPIGVPKVLVSTMAAGNVGLFVGTRDLCLLHSVTDVAGLDRVSRGILVNAANATAGMVLGEPPGEGGGKPLVAITMFGVTTPAVLRVQSALENDGFETIVFHAVGSGGRAMEEMIAEGIVDAVIDVTTSELTDYTLGGIFDAGPDRLEAAGRLGIPQVVVPGALEVLNFGPRATIPTALDVPERRVVVHNPSVSAVRVNRDEAAELGRLLARKVNAATGPVAVVLPLGGLSKYSAPGGPFVDPDADEALFAAVRETLRDDVPLLEVDANVNDVPFADAVVAAFHDVWARQEAEVAHA
ncbi:MAG: Tm-1-like ATP-binding domain-containing protein, partial [Actinomycetota bacterium]|nr:Tm-1-like ATP-binding domain-containing protein [Actinomycetota bacterium]